MKAKVLLSGFAALLVVISVNFIGCFGEDPVDEDSATVTLTGGIASMVVGTTYPIGGTVEASPAISETGIGVVITLGATDVTSGFTVNKTAFTAKEEIDLTADCQLSVKPGATVASGTYTITVTATAGTASASDNFSFTITNNIGTPITTATFTAGANNNSTYGSSIDLDLGVAMLSAEAATKVATIDLVYAYSGTTSEDKLFSPHHAKASGFTFALNWTNPPEIKFYKTTLTAAQYNAITTKEEVAALWTDPGVVGTSVACVLNDVFIALTTENVYVLMLISAQTSGATGTIQMKIAK